MWIDEMAADQDGGRWARFAREAVRNQVMSMLSLRLPGAGASATVLNLYAYRAGMFDRTTRTTAILFAHQAGLALRGAEQAAELAQEVVGRDVVDQAKGILMERHRVDADRAFVMLVDASQDTDLELREVARQLTETTGTGSHPRPARIGPPRPTASAGPRRVDGTSSTRIAPR